MDRIKHSVRALVFLLIAGISVLTVSASKAGYAPNFGLREILQLIPTWQQANTSGFGDPQAREVTALEGFNGYLYAGTYNTIDLELLFDGAQIFRSADGVSWTAVTQPGFGNSHDIAPPAVLDFIVFNNQLYAGTGRGNASQIWRSLNGTTWAPMDVTGFSDPDNVNVTTFAVYNNMIYAGVTNQVTGAQIWRSFTGNNNEWTQVAPDLPGTAPSSITGLAEFDGALYAVVESEAPAQIWQSFGGGSGTWTAVVEDGFGDPNNGMTGGMTVFGGYLYVGVGNTTSGAQLWRTNDGSIWAQVITPGFGDPNNRQVEMVFVFQNQLYAGVENQVTGIELWRSADGTTWEQANADGFGDSNNTTTNGSSAAAEFLAQLFVGASNLMDGGEIWRMQPQVMDTPTPTITDTLTALPTDTPTVTETQTVAPIPTDTATGTQTFTPTFTATYTPPATATDTPMPSLTFTPTNTLVFTATDTPSSPPSETPTQDPSFTPSATFTQNANPTDTPLISPTLTATSEPTSTPIPTPGISTPGKVTGGGNLMLPREKVTFGFVVQYREGDQEPSGNLVFIDRSAQLSLKATSFTMLQIDGDQAWVEGIAIVNGVRDVKFNLMIYEHENEQKADRLILQIEDMNGYSFEGTVFGGNIKISSLSE